ncbi:hypothetical protein AMTRI_Chr11g154970 [Amborella trichopoda]
MQIYICTFAFSFLYTLIHQPHFPLSNLPLIKKKKSGVNKVSSIVSLFISSLSTHAFIRILGCKETKIPRGKNCHPKNFKLDINFFCLSRISRTSLSLTLMLFPLLPAFLSSPSALFLMHEKKTQSSLSLSLSLSLKSSANIELCSLLFKTQRSAAKKLSATVKNTSLSQDQASSLA